MEEYFNTPEITAYVMEIETSVFSILMNLPGEMYKYISKKFKDMAYNLNMAIKEQFELVIISSLGNPYSHPLEAYRSYEEAKTALQSRFTHTNTDVIIYSDIKEEVMKEFRFTFHHQVLIANFLKTGDIAKAEALTGSILEDSFLRGNIKTNDGLFILYGIISAAQNALIESGLETTDTLNIIQLNSLKNYYETVTYIKDILRTACDKINRIKISSEDNLPKSIVEYIDRNFNRSDLSLTMLSEEFSLSTVYISKIIKGYLGRNFTDYLNYVRIKKSLEYLKDNSKYNIKDIVVLVGFDNDMNFRRVFKKYEGILPSQYRESMTISGK